MMNLAQIKDGDNVVSLDPDGFRLGEVTFGKGYVEFREELPDGSLKEPARIYGQSASTPEAGLQVVTRGARRRVRKEKVDPVLRVRTLVAVLNFVRDHGGRPRGQSLEAYVRELVAEPEFGAISLKLPVKEGALHFILYDNVIAAVDPARSHFAEQIAQDLFDVLLREYRNGRVVPPWQFCRQVTANIEKDKLRHLVFLKLRNRLTLYIYSEGDLHMSLLQQLEQQEEDLKELFDRTVAHGLHRGRPKRSEEDESRALRQLKVRVTDEELALVDLVAELTGETKSQFVLRAVFARIKQELPGLAAEMEADPEGFIQSLMSRDR